MKRGELEKLEVSNVEGGYQLMKNFGDYDCLGRKIVN